MGCHFQSVQSFQPIDSVPTNSLASVPTTRICTHMLKEMIKLRVSVEELALWRQSAEKSGAGLSEWIRERCNGGERRQQRDAAAGSGLPERVTPPNLIEKFVLGVCANCLHKKSRHGGFGDCCQEDNCMCPSFE